MSSSTKLHPRNKHIHGYDFARLIKGTPALKSFTRKNPSGQTTIDFQDDKGVRTLNQALLKSYYGVSFWEIPDNFLCPPIPGRADYIHYLADLLAEDNTGGIPIGREVRVLDIGTGANLIYPLIGHAEYGWHFSGTDIDVQAIQNAKAICKRNKLNINIRHQTNRKQLFNGIIGPKDRFQLTMCNPPFHASAAAAQKGTQRKWKNLGKGPSKKLNFGGQKAELWCPGGEMKFIARMIEESVSFKDQVGWFTSLVSKKENLKPLERLVKKSGAREFKIVDMAQGQKVSRFIAWTFQEKEQRKPQ
ncbi:23S rRNA (adenine(1618)-N(6))-methyltransferase RlmF [Terasakiella sp. A23]|uniref:23S rRNA (adenine(1618)-N(6))-methyltransferase RlmF n=1 Tax=Terasakiella sp. FCG-A23 TaxID=3080561 RepID=UPI002953E39A|nr:23S rRNA (adenine(1618)-N(6))-methyltransferase RlmF [Terasakiella sp. A23]MDV7338639.1 23S rRNA (adenine(1618)-N(6))-methyltransferase RlmF [Terasakiella sp. A23]